MKIPQRHLEALKMTGLIILLLAVAIIAAWTVIMLIDIAITLYHAGFMLGILLTVLVIVGVYLFSYWWLRYS